MKPKIFISYSHRNCNFRKSPNSSSDLLRVLLESEHAIIPLIGSGVVAQAAILLTQLLLDSLNAAPGAMIHRDIKPQDIIRKDDQALLIDLGISRPAAKPRTEMNYLESECINYFLPAQSSARECKEFAMMRAGMSYIIKKGNSGRKSVSCTVSDEICSPIYVTIMGNAASGKSCMLAPLTKVAGRSKARKPLIQNIRYCVGENIMFLHPCDAQRGLPDQLYTSQHHDLDFIPRNCSRLTEQATSLKKSITRTRSEIKIADLPDQNESESESPSCRVFWKQESRSLVEYQCWGTASHSDQPENSGQAEWILHLAGHRHGSGAKHTPPPNPRDCFREICDLLLERHQSFRSYYTDRNQAEVWHEHSHCHINVKRLVIQPQTHGVDTSHLCVSLPSKVINPSTQNSHALPVCFTHLDKCARLTALAMALKPGGFTDGSFFDDVQHLVCSDSKEEHWLHGDIGRYKKESFHLGAGGWSKAYLRKLVRNQRIRNKRREFVKVLQWPRYEQKVCAKLPRQPSSTKNRHLPSLSICF